jgi:hypothetical protein
MRKHIAVLDITDRSGRDRFEEIVNRPGVQLESAHDFFGQGPDGTVLERVVDYLAPDADAGAAVPLLFPELDQAYPLPCT